jgi:hypothetical protein
VTAQPSGEPGAAEDCCDRGKHYRAGNLKLARTDPAAHAAFVLRHERTNKRIRLAEMHEEWHELWTSEKRLILWGFPESGKTSQVIGRLAYEIGRDTSKRLAVVGISQGASAKVVGTVAKYLESPQYRAVFPDIARGALWTKTGITVARPFFSKDPTLQAVAVRGHIIGNRLDGVLMDDVLDHLTTRNREQRLETIRWYLSELAGRLTENAFVWVIGNAYYADDLLHELALKHGFRWRRYPIRNEETGEPAFPQEWTEARIAKLADELGGEGSPEANRQLYCIARTDEASRVKASWIDACLERGEDLQLVERIEPDELAGISEPEEDGRAGIPATTHTGVDLGVGRKKKHAKTVMATVLRWPNGDLQIVGYRAGRWGSREIVALALGEQERFSSQVAVESNGAQQFLIDEAYEEDPAAELFVFGHHTGSNKTDPVIGVEALFADLARTRMVIPSVRTEGGRLIGATPELRELCADLLDYNPESHTSDHIMALWIARENARKTHLGSRRPEVDVKVIGAKKAPDRGGPEEDDPEENAGWGSVLRSKQRAESRL